MATIFWDCEGILLIEYTAKGTMINVDVYGTTTEYLKKALKAKLPNS